MPFSFTLVWYLNWGHKKPSAKCTWWCCLVGLLWQEDKEETGCSFCPAVGWACPYCYFWMCWFSMAAVCNIYKIWVATYVILKGKQVRCVFIAHWQQELCTSESRFSLCNKWRKACLKPKQQRLHSHMFQWISLLTVLIYTLLTLYI